MPKIGDVITVERPEGSLFRRATIELVPFPDKAREERALETLANALLPGVLREMEKIVEEGEQNGRAVNR